MFNWNKRRCRLLVQKYKDNVSWRCQTCKYNSWWLLWTNLHLTGMEYVPRHFLYKLRTLKKERKPATWFRYDIRNNNKQHTFNHHVWMPLPLHWTLHPLCPASEGTAEQSAKINATIRAGRLNDSEIFWRILQPWLLERGHQLRDRFAPDWTPSWLKGRKSVIAYPDGLRLVVSMMVIVCKQDTHSL